MKKQFTIITCCLLLFASVSARQKQFKVIAFYTGKNDKAHISFVKEANQWFIQKAIENNFVYDTTTNWNNLNKKFLSNYSVVLFLDTRPETIEQRKAFEEYMNHGGAWMGFHFAAFALTPSDYPQNWDWYHNTFLGSGSYKSNTWRPTPAVLRIEEKDIPATASLPDTFRSAPNEWYCWENDLTKNKDIEVIASIDSTSFPLGTGPKLYEIWHSGYYPVVWRNKNYNMIYFNMGHNDIDYEHGTNRELSQSFGNKLQGQLVLQSLLWLAEKNKMYKANH